MIAAILRAMTDLDELIKHGDLKHLTSPAQISTAKFRTAMSQPSPPAYIKEKGQLVSHFGMITVFSLERVL